MYNSIIFIFLLLILYFVFGIIFIYIISWLIELYRSIVNDENFDDENNNTENILEYNVFAFLKDLETYLSNPDLKNNEMALYKLNKKYNHYNYIIITYKYLIKSLNLKYRKKYINNIYSIHLLSRDKLLYIEFLYICASIIKMSDAIIRMIIDNVDFDQIIELLLNVIDNIVSEEMLNWGDEYLFLKKEKITKIIDRYTDVWFKNIIRNNNILKNNKFKFLLTSNKFGKFLLVNNIYLGKIIASTDNKIQNNNYRNHKINLNDLLKYINSLIKFGLISNKNLILLLLNVVAQYNSLKIIFYLNGILYQIQQKNMSEDIKTLFIDNIMQSIFRQMKIKNME